MLDISENAEADERFWSSLRDMASTVADHKCLAARAADAIANGEARVSKADANAKAVRERVAAIERGENVEGSLGQSMTFEDCVRIMQAAGWTARDFR